MAAAERTPRSKSCAGLFLPPVVRVASVWTKSSLISDRGHRPRFLPPHSVIPRGGSNLHRLKQSGGTMLKQSFLAFVRHFIVTAAIAAPIASADYLVSVLPSITGN